MKYKIEYQNGFIQFKNLVSEDTYKYKIKPLIDLAQNYAYIGNKKMESYTKKRIKDSYGEYFTEKSPLGLAINTGVIELPLGHYKCMITKL